MLAMSSELDWPSHRHAVVFLGWEKRRKERQGECVIDWHVQRRLPQTPCQRFRERLPFDCKSWSWLK
ncbi:hypothetical protein K435DRAFT_779747 [Dendrothele bispora CBS 962.96]|uniref:Uncharacterized protein n=1 Tax=Dendrothele bispora (strain CBS 962.96) TaxID=1314807 RepID=A0A4S8LVE7_DENBC|nr:hypothetical protein K435DRAFT_779747 [Dendrothele bispora CBS 962.96]